MYRIRERGRTMGRPIFSIAFNSIRYAVIVLLIGIMVRVDAQVLLSGFVPHEITPAAVSYEFKKIWATLAPAVPVVTKPVAVIFYTKKGIGGNDYSLPEWGGGGAIGADTIVVCIDKNPFLEQGPYQVMVHELVHIALHRIVGETDIPRWFHEGLAMVLSGEANDRENSVLSKALFSGDLMPLSSIDSVNAFGRFRAELAYCQSRQTVVYLINTYGIEVSAEILNNVRKTGDFWRGVYETVQVSEIELNNFSRSFILAHYNRFVWLLDLYRILLRS
jgi:hypothetical protein